MSYTDLRNSLPGFFYNEEIKEYCTITEYSTRSEDGFLDWICKIPLDIPESN